MKTKKFVLAFLLLVLACISSSSRGYAQTQQYFAYFPIVVRPPACWITAAQQREKIEITFSWEGIPEDQAGMALVLGLDGQLTDHIAYGASGEIKFLIDYSLPTKDVVVWGYLGDGYNAGPRCVFTSPLHP